MTLSDAPRDLMDPLHYDKLSSRLGQLNSLFDWIILDGPPLLESPDAEIASMLDVTERTVRREWRKARAFLYREMGGEPGMDDAS